MKLITCLLISQRSGFNEKSCFVNRWFSQGACSGRVLDKKGYSVTVINNDYQKCLHLAEIDALSVIYGDGTRPFVLEDANAQGADIAIALTQDDADNLIICELCKKMFHIKKQSL